MLLLHVPRAALRRPLAGNVRVVEVVVLGPHAACENLLEAVRPHVGLTRHEVELGLGHTAEGGEPGPHPLLFEEVADGGEAERGGRVAHLLDHVISHTEEAEGRDEKLGGEAGGAWGGWMEGEVEGEVGWRWVVVGRGGWWVVD